jgi:hypothetical protein
MKMKQKVHNQIRTAGMGTPKSEGLDRIIFSPLSFLMYVLRMLLHVHVKLILREWPSIPAIKVKQKRSRQMD